jgi:hyperosmotically inducible protein
MSADAVAASARKMKEQRAQQAHELSETARRELKKKWKRREREMAERAPVVTVESSGEKWLWLLVGIGIGAALGILLAPNAGKRTRAVLKDKLGRGPAAASGLGEDVARRVQKISNRAAGLAHEISHKHTGQGDDGADDVTIADRVRTELGRLEKEHGLERINVDSFDGVVTLRGPVGEQSVADALVAAASGVLGVREVKNDLAVEASGESFVG